VKLAVSDEMFSSLLRIATVLLALACVASSSEKWLRMAASQGIEKAQYELAVVLLRKEMMDRAKSATVVSGKHLP
jgi:hypothetical protein